MCVCAQDEIERQGSVLVDYADLTRDKRVRQALPDLITLLKEQPEVILNCLGVAVHQVHAHSCYNSTHISCCLQVTDYQKVYIHMYVHSLLNTLGKLIFKVIKQPENKFLACYFSILAIHSKSKNYENY